MLKVNEINEYEDNVLSVTSVMSCLICSTIMLIGINDAVAFIGLAIVTS